MLYVYCKIAVPCQAYMAHLKGIYLVPVGTSEYLPHVASLVQVPVVRLNPILQGGESMSESALGLEVIRPGVFLKDGMVHTARFFIHEDRSVCSVHPTYILCNRTRVTLV